MSLISADQTFQLATILAGLAAFGFWAETTQLGRKLSGVLIILFLGVVLANIGLIPHSAPMYGTVSSLLVPLAIPMLLFKADLKQVIAEIGPMFKSFVASAGVIAFSIILLTLLFDFGPYEAQVAGTLTGSYIGGSLNFVATAQAVEFADPNHYIMPALAFVRRAMPSPYFSVDSSGGDSEPVVHEEGPGVPFNMIGLAAALATSLAICALGQLLAKMLGQENYFILIITVLALGVANFVKPLVRNFNAEFEVGTFFMYMFFVTIGASADLATIAGAALPYVVLICASVCVFFVLIIIVGKLLKLDLAELMIAANACILGPATAAALAAGHGWRDLVTPGMLTGILGYAVGTFIGVGTTNLLTWLL